MLKRLMQRILKPRRIEIGFTREMTNSDLKRNFSFNPDHPFRVGVNQLIDNCAAELINTAAQDPDDTTGATAALGGVAALLSLKGEIDDNLIDAEVLIAEEIAEAEKKVEG